MFGYMWRLALRESNASLEVHLANLSHILVEIWETPYLKYRILHSIIIGWSSEIGGGGTSWIFLVHNFLSLTGLSFFSFLVNCCFLLFSATQGKRIKSTKSLELVITGFLVVWIF